MTSCLYLHTLGCKKGGLVTQSHNEDRDVFGNLATIVYKEVMKELVRQEANNSEGVPSLISDLSIRGVWKPQAVALFDVHVTDTDTSSHSRVVTAILSSAEEERKKKIFRSSNSLLSVLHTSCCIS